MKDYWLLVMFIALLTACGSDNNDVESDVKANKQSNVSEQYVKDLPITDNSEVNHYKVLFIGNSHVQPLKSLVSTLIEKGLAEKVVTVEVGHGTFLDVALHSEDLIEQLQGNSWSHVILQGQKYSQSREHTYPTSATKLWIQRVKHQSATPMLFPEHPQKGDLVEGQYVHNIHVAIAEEEASCVAPVGLVWDRALQLKPQLELHSSDGNHATSIGSLLTALVFYEMITGQSADLLPFIQELPADEATQSFLGQIASQVIAENENCNY
ncbi:hypothetical protein RI844_15920 [Thalassotalea fonticola]|uniref:Uncharacterized protein n=1 Tax=Thalassotalea fonticola TaxID=3065649 RepID=A0ABZ0GMC1_9GAMM|nr:hypothetical protein RI844_15920 [Colwelliaceae bacterium S1-1]